MLRKALPTVLASILIAWGYAAISYLIFFVITDRDRLIATIGNVVVILGVVIWDRVETRAARRASQAPRQGPGAARRSRVGRLVVWLTSGDASIKTGLYLFYVVVLICYALLAAAPTLFGSADFDAYLSTVYYGLLILLAADQYARRLFEYIE